MTEREKCIRRFPARLTILHRQVRLEFCEVVKSDEGEDLRGYYLGREGLIKIDTGHCCGADMADTVLHEILHAIADIHGAPENMNDEDRSRFYGAALTAFMLANPCVLWEIECLANCP